jgi:hypothetical protein
MSIGGPDTHPATSGRTAGAVSKHGVDAVGQERPTIHGLHGVRGGHGHSSAPSPMATWWRYHHLAPAECAAGADGQRVCCRIGRNRWGTAAAQCAGPDTPKKSAMATPRTISAMPSCARPCDARSPAWRVCTPPPPSRSLTGGLPARGAYYRPTLLKLKSAGPGLAFQ